MVKLGGVLDLRKAVDPRDIFGGGLGSERGHSDYSRQELAGAGTGQGPVGLGQDQGSVCGRV